MRTETTTRTLYQYYELSDKAKERARDWYRRASEGDNFFAEYITDQFHEAARAFGFDLDKKRTPQWSGFSHQGAGASFRGTWYASGFAPADLLADRPATWERDGKQETSESNAELHRIASELRGLVDARLRRATITDSHRSFHMGVDNAECDDEEGDAFDAPEELADRLLECARDLAHWFFRSLEREYEYTMSDECVAETIIANEYEFTENGERA